MVCVWSNIERNERHTEARARKRNEIILRISRKMHECNATDEGSSLSLYDHHRGGHKLESQRLNERLLKQKKCK